MLKAIYALLLFLSLHYVSGDDTDDGSVATMPDNDDQDDGVDAMAMSTTEDSGEDLSTTDSGDSADLSTTDDSNSGSDSDSASGEGSSDISSTDSGSGSDSEDSEDSESNSNDSGDSDSNSDDESSDDSGDSDDSSNSDDNSSDESQDDTSSDDDNSEDDASSDDNSEDGVSSEDDQDTEDDTNTSADTDTNDQVDVEDDPCDDLSADECADNWDQDTGAQLCALNIDTGACYEIVESRGVYGKGNFDDGYNAAKDETTATTQQLNTVVGIMGGLIAVLVLVIAAGGYWIYSKKNAIQIDMEDDEVHYRENVRLDTAEDAEPMIIADRD